MNTDRPSFSFGPQQFNDADKWAADNLFKRSLDIKPTELRDEWAVPTAIDSAWTSQLRHRISAYLETHAHDITNVALTALFAMLIIGAFTSGLAVAIRASRVAKGPFTPYIARQILSAAPTLLVGIAFVGGVISGWLPRPIRRVAVQICIGIFIAAIVAGLAFLPWS